MKAMWVEIRCLFLGFYSLVVRMAERARSWGQFSPPLAIYSYLLILTHFSISSSHPPYPHAFRIGCPLRFVLLMWLPTTRLNERRSKKSSDFIICFQNKKTHQKITPHNTKITLRHIQHRFCEVAEWTDSRVEIGSARLCWGESVITMTSSMNESCVCVCVGCFFSFFRIVQQRGNNLDKYERLCKTQITVFVLPRPQKKKRKKGRCTGLAQSE